MRAFTFWTGPRLAPILESYPFSANDDLDSLRRSTPKHTLTLPFRSTA